ncbi:MAG: hypothetical protein SFY66_01900 [Oculatellaceae cyanobacterium bins.114]|nr:hypothetical protein [Oculatellaceae cyanobacterium bins.114]
MPNKTTYWRSLSLVFLMSGLLGLTNAYKANALPGHSLGLASAFIYGVAFFVGFQASRTALYGLEQRLSQGVAFVSFAAIVGTGYGVGFASLNLITAIFR